MEQKADKFDKGKPMMSLIDPKFLEGVAKVLTFGASKYGKHNWTAGLRVSRLLDAGFRHLNSFNAGENLDPESGESHLFHAACCLMMANHFMNTEFDDRFTMI